MPFEASLVVGIEEGVSIFLLSRIRHGSSTVYEVLGTDFDSLSLLFPEPFRI